MPSATSLPNPTGPRSWTGRTCLAGGCCGEEGGKCLACHGGVPYYMYMYMYMSSVCVCVHMCACPASLSLCGVAPSSFNLPLACLPAPQTRPQLEAGRAQRAVQLLCICEDRRKAGGGAGLAPQQSCRGITAHAAARGGWHHCAHRSLAPLPLVLLAISTLRHFHQGSGASSKGEASLLRGNYGRHCCAFLHFPSVQVQGGARSLNASNVLS